MIKEVAYQVDAVKELVKKTRELLLERGDRLKLVFKAPTGAGKTVMASQMLDELTTELANVGREAAFIWIAPNKLHQQSYLSMKNYFTETRVLQPVVYEELDHSIDGYIRPGEIFFVNWESINKDKNVMVRDTENSSSIYDIVRRTKEQGLDIVVVIDEEHMFGGRQATQSEKVLHNINPKVEIRISATPITINFNEIVMVSRSKVIAAQMIKDGITINPSVADNGEGMTENEYLLEQAIQKREEIKAAYEKLGVRINPLLLIQLPNDNKDTLDENERSLMEMIKTRLDAHYGINTNNEKLAIWLSNEKTNLDGISEPYNVTEALLFKQAIALGWDCPRAAVLLIFRDIQSQTFGVQTVGRIMRMPEQKYYPDQVLNHGWVYTNLNSNQVNIAPEDFGYLTKSLMAYRRDALNNVSLPSVYSERLSAERNRLGAGFKKVLYETFNDNWFHAPYQPSLFDFLYEEEGAEQEVASQNESNSESLFGDIGRNRKQAERIANIDFSNHGIVVQLISDVEVTGDAGTTDVEETQRKAFARNSEELAAAMTKWCAKMLPGFESQSALSLRGYLYEMMEELLGIFETEAPRIMLYYVNRPKFEEVIIKAIARYKKIIEANRRAAKQRAFKDYLWEVPQSREYNEKANHAVPEVVDHALMPFVKLNNASNAETNFEAFLEQWADCIDWWYKNGDEGKQHYSIAYEQTDASQGLFYVDYIIRMKNGQVFLFDTKTQGSDIEAPQKHNALLKYMSSEKNASLNLKGGVIIEQGSNWMYSEFAIEDTNDLSGWTAFHPDHYKE